MDVSILNRIYLDVAVVFFTHHTHRFLSSLKSPPRYCVATAVAELGSRPSLPASNQAPIEVTLVSSYLFFVIVPRKSLWLQLL
ncbi:hypothetical protein HanRHA438_Chr03g0135641 [Helianthus annuus]|nr:hypothetical protein HanRHA438_Chr03g0135641 [Helianthus annuus]